MLSKEEKGKVVGVYMDPDTHEEVKRQAWHQHMSVAGLLRYYIWDHSEDFRRKKKK